ncbi:hypothetical protein K474DRAFT_1638109 [Panus rudis PR-1116 ss-1]|nr:hypothetical protein K474DRAFT_1638109 [Panus rudis PR-1116 ss-1]
MPKYVPPELVSYIMDYLLDDINTLSSCALVCKSWLHTSRKHRFMKVTITAEECSLRDKCIAFMTFLKAFPDIMIFVRHLILNVKDSFGNPSDDIPVADTILLLPRLRELSIYNKCKIGKGLPPGYTLRPIEKVNMHLRGSTSENLHTVVSTLALFSTIQNLSVFSARSRISGLSWWDRGMLAETPRDIRVSSLSLRTVEPMCHLLCQTFNTTETIRSLTSLEILYAAMSEVESLRVWFTAPHSRLSHLLFNPAYTVSDADRPVPFRVWSKMNLAACNSLESLVLMVDVREKGGFDFDYVGAVCDAALDILNLAPPSLKVITFRLHMYSNDEVVVTLKRLDRQRLERILSIFPHLASVAIENKAERSPSSSVPDDDWRRIIATDILQHIPTGVKLHY